jgi:hypothetical protein
MKVYVVFQQGSFNTHREEKRIKGVFSSYQKAEECISNLSYGDTNFSIICFELDKKPNYFNAI